MVKSIASIVADNSAYVAAKGAAEMAWRALDHDERMEL